MTWLAVLVHPLQGSHLLQSLGLVLGIICEKTNTDPTQTP